MKYVRITKCKNFNEWKERTIAIAKRAGFAHHLQTDVTILDDAKINEIEEAAWAEPNEVKKQIQLRNVKNQRQEAKLRKAAALLMTMSVDESTLKKLSKDLENPKKMFEAVEEKYGRQPGDGYYRELLEDFSECKLKSKRTNPDDI